MGDEKKITGDVVIRTTEMHSAGEPVRIVESGYPEILGDTILEKRRYVKENLDHLRRFLMTEPRGHYDMYGALLVNPDHPEADIAVLFMHNEGYSTMCGHATIALGRYAVDRGLVKSSTQLQEVPVNIQCPCGLVRAYVERKDGKTGRTRFTSVPAFAFALGYKNLGLKELTCIVDVEVEVEGVGQVKVDIGYGGAFYALVKDSSLGVDIRTTRVSQLTSLATAVSEAVRSTVTLTHPDSADLAFLYGTIVTDGKDEFCSEPTVNLTIFADSEVDRAPTGSGVTARVAVQHARGLIDLNQVRTFESAANGSKYTGKAVETTRCGDFQAVTVEVGGTSFYTGSAEFTAEVEDDLRGGFLVK